MLPHLLICLTAWATSVSAQSTHNNPIHTEDKSAATILAYQRIGEDNLPESNLSRQQFEDHINEITNGDYTVLPLPTIINALKSATPLPQRTLAITLDGGFRSAYDNAVPLLLKNNLPFTVFFPAGAQQTQNHIGWKQLKSLSRKNGVTLGILPPSYNHITHLPPAEQKRQINIARANFRKHINTEARYFAYPFGETSTTLKNIIKTQNFDAAFALQSGVAHKKSDFTALPRFTMTDNYGDLQRFRLVTNALPFPATDIEPENPRLNTQTPTIGFTLPAYLENKQSALSCFISGQEKPDIEILGNRVEIRPKEPLDARRTRVNCTLPASKDENDTPRWRWLGMLLHTPQ